MNVAYYYIRNNAILQNVKTTVNDKTKTILVQKEGTRWLNYQIYLFIYLLLHPFVFY